MSLLPLLSDASPSPVTHASTAAPVTHDVPTPAATAAPIISCYSLMPLLPSAAPAPLPTTPPPARLMVVWFCRVYFLILMG